MPARSAFLECHEVTAKWEGGWSNHPSDPGGKTMYGITEAVWLQWNRDRGISKPKPVRQITRAEAEEIYFNNYWLAAGCQKLAPGVDLCTYDSAVNSGVSRSRKWLLASIGGTDIETIKKMCAARLSFLRALTNWAVFGKGWLNRVTDVEAQALKRNLSSQGASTAATNRVLEQEAATAAKDAATAEKRAKQSAAGSAAGGTGGYASTELASPENANMIAGWILGGALTIGVLALTYFIVRSIIQKAREKSLKGEAA